LVVEDDATIGDALASTLSTGGHDVSWYTSGDDAVASARVEVPALVILDLGLPDRDGLDVCRELRLIAPRTRIIMLTARADELDTVLGLDAGADDYVTKPFRLPELLARVRAHLRRADSDEDDSEPIRAGDVTLDRSSRRVWVQGNEVELRPKEFDLLAFLMSEARRVVTRERIMEAVWDEHWFRSTKTLDMHVLALRRKLGGAQTHITTLRHVGYRLDP